MAVIPARTRPKWLAAITRRRLILAALACFVFGTVTFIATWVRICANDACPSVDEIDHYDPAQASKIFAADGRLITDLGVENRSLVTLAEMSPAIPAAFLAMEDRRFYKHHGVDWIRVFGAIKSNLLHVVGLSSKQGFSTITMQLARNIWPDVLDPTERTGIKGVRRKLREVHVALEIESKYPKEKILELYLNQIYLRAGYGVEAASGQFFGKHAHDLTVAEAAMLAALPKNPKEYNPRMFPRAAMRQRNIVLEAMGEAKVLTPEEVESWKGYPVLLSARADFTGVAEYFVEYVRLLLKDRPWGEDLNRSGLRIYTTLDLDAQIAVERALEDQLQRIESGQANGKFPHPTYQEYLDKREGQPGNADNTPYLQGAALVMEAKTGNILAMVGGRDYNDSKFNRMIQGQRQPGSTFKPIVYSAAVESGVSLDEEREDVRLHVQLPFGQGEWSPQNFDGEPTGTRMTIRSALWKSVNTIAAKVGLEVGIPAVLEEAKRFGISAKIDSVPSIMLGSATVTPIEMIAAYTTFANLGKRTIPNAIVRVEDKKGNILWKPKPKPGIDVLDPVTAYTMNVGLRGVVTSGTANPPVWSAGFRFPSGGKTGTTSDYWDVWYVGYTSDIVAGVWMGFDTPQKIMTNAQGSKLAAPAWTQFMKEIYDRRPAPADWSQPVAEQVGVVIDKSTGQLATPYCPDSQRELRFFAKGTEPKVFCKVHSPYGGTAGGNH